MTFTTADTPVTASWSNARLQQILVGLYALVWVWAAISPISRSDWFLENLLVAVGVGTLFWLYRRQPLSDVSAVMLTVFFVLHTVGSHYTYSEVPIGYWARDFLGLERNHYDRVVHFTFGLLFTYPLREVILRERITQPAWAGVFAFTLVGTGSALYEIMEWLVGAIVDPAAGMAFLGTQGDVFDSQKDSGMAILGSIVALAVTLATRRRR